VLQPHVLVAVALFRALGVATEKSLLLFPVSWQPPSLR
jgi:hypothetical protein